MRDPTCLPRHEVRKVDQYWLAVDALDKPEAPAVDLKDLLPRMVAS